MVIINDNGAHGGGKDDVDDEDDDECDDGDNTENVVMLFIICKNKFIHGYSTNYQINTSSQIWKSSFMM
mgnify:CR=1 FL=1